MSDLGASSRSFSIGSDRFFEAIRPYRRTGAVWFPRELQGKPTRRDPREKLHAWFGRMVDQLGVDAPESFAVEANIGLLAAIKWAEGSRITYANVQAIVASCSLMEYYSDPTQQAFYLRLDCDDQTLGEPFSHPFPHIHLDDELGPRFPLEGGKSADVVVDFVEFLFRNYKPDLWLGWAQEVWDRDYARRHPRTPEDNPMPRIVAAFKSSQLHVLRDHDTDLFHWKRLLALAKKPILGLTLDPSDRELLEYPTAL